MCERRAACVVLHDDERRARHVVRVGAEARRETAYECSFSRAEIPVEQNEGARGQRARQLRRKREGFLFGVRDESFRQGLTVLRHKEFERELALFGFRGRREVRLRVAALAVPGQGPAGAVIVLEDVTPLMQAQKVAAWGEVARKLAHEIKNPLTPIKLSAQRVKKAHLRKGSDFDQVLSESTDAIVSEVDALQHLVDEFAQFARLPPSRPVEGSINAVVEGALALYETAYANVVLERRLDPEIPLLRLDGPQLKRVIINLVDNAIAAMGEKGVIEITTVVDRALRRAVLTIGDSGPGVPVAKRETIFAPNFSTKRKGSGLGLAIARRIVEDHGGEISVEDNTPLGARFVIELPA